MARYAWPAEPTLPSDALDERSERQAVDNIETPPGLFAELDDLNDVIEANFDEQRLWIPMGPDILIKGQADNSPPVSGRAKAVRVSADGSRVYIATAKGGVWYSSDSGQSWSPVGAGGLRPATERSDLSLVASDLLVQFDETAPAAGPHHDVVYVATGEAAYYSDGTTFTSPKGRPGGKFSGIGVLRLEGSIEDAIGNPGSNPWRREARNLTGVSILRLACLPGQALAADDAGANEIVAATTLGLYARRGAFVDDADWERIDVADFDIDDEASTSDVAWTDQGLWVTVMKHGDGSGLWRSKNTTAGASDLEEDFSQIALPGLFGDGRMSIGAVPHAPGRLYVFGKVSPPAGKRGYSALWQVDLAHSDVTAVRVGSVPFTIFTSQFQQNNAGQITIKSDQSNYDQAIAVTQSGSNDRVALAGSALVNNASIFQLTISGTAAAGNLSTDFTAAQTSPATDATFVGRGVHADVHALTWAGTDLWVGCDGGIFRRDNGGTVHSHNIGLPTVEPGYISSNFANANVMIAGLQDNGMIRRIAPLVWEMLEGGDGGGCAYHPSRPRDYISQYINAQWRFSPDQPFYGPAVRNSRSNMTAGEKRENGNASFYSQPAVAPTTDGGKARLFIGTDRIWYCDNWGDQGNAMNWRTIPTLNDPYPNTAQDRLAAGEEVYVIEILQDGDPAQNFDGMAILVMTNEKVRVFRFTDGAGWSSIADSDLSGERPKDKKEGDADPSKDHLPKIANSTWTDLAVHDNSTSGRETFYVSTSGAATVDGDGELEGVEHFDTLWWYDGGGQWYPTGLRNAPLDSAAGTGGCPLPAFSVVCEGNDVFVGTSIGVWHGTIDQSGTHPAWTWRPAMEGLPQAVVEDLHIVDGPGGRFLRAALQSRGMWERDISEAPNLVGNIYLRTTRADNGSAPIDPASLVAGLATDIINGNGRRLDHSPDLVLTETGAFGARTPHAGDFADADISVGRTFGRSIAPGTYRLWITPNYRDTRPLDPGQVSIDLFRIYEPVEVLSATTIDAGWVDHVMEGLAGNLSPGDGNDNFAYIGRVSPGEPLTAGTTRPIGHDVDLGFPFTAAMTGHEPFLIIACIQIDPDRMITRAMVEQGNFETLLRTQPQIAARRFWRLR